MNSSRQVSIAVFLRIMTAKNNLRIQMSQTQLSSVEAFQAHYAQHQQRYEAVSARSNMPAPLIAAIHQGESTGDFDTYLHQGDPRSTGRQ